MYDTVSTSQKDANPQKQIQKTHGFGSTDIGCVTTRSTDETSADESTFATSGPHTDESQAESSVQNEEVNFEPCALPSNRSTSQSMNAFTEFRTLTSTVAEHALNQTLDSNNLRKSGSKLEYNNSDAIPFLPQDSIEYSNFHPKNLLTPLCDTKFIGRDVLSAPAVPFFSLASDFFISPSNQIPGVFFPPARYSRVDEGPQGPPLAKSQGPPLAKIESPVLMPSQQSLHIQTCTSTHEEKGNTQMHTCTPTHGEQLNTSRLSQMHNNIAPPYFHHNSIDHQRFQGECYLQEEDFQGRVLMPRGRKSPQKRVQKHKGYITHTHTHTDNMHESMIYADPEKHIDSAEWVQGRVASLAKTQSGSRFLQKQVCKGHPLVVSQILKEAQEDIVELMTDTYGNYLCQHLFRTCGVEQKRFLLEAIAANAVCISVDRRGTHSMQALIGSLSVNEEEQLLLQKIKSNVVYLANDANGTHVLQRIVVCFKPPSTECVFGPVLHHLRELAQNPHGLCVLKRCMSASKETNSRYQQEILHKLSAHAPELLQDPYGNYAIQHAIDVWGPSLCEGIIQHVVQCLIPLSTQKFSSNVVEKCIERCDPRELQVIFAQFADPVKMGILVNCSSYGNFVVQKALAAATWNQRRDVQNAIIENIRGLQNRSLKAKWEKLLTNMPGEMGRQYIPGVYGFNPMSYMDMNMNVRQRQQHHDVINMSMSPMRYEQRNYYGTNQHPHEVPAWPRRGADYSRSNWAAAEYYQNHGGMNHGGMVGYHN